MLCPSLVIQCWGMLCASFLVGNGTGTCFVQAQACSKDTVVEVFTHGKLCTKRPSEKCPSISLYFQVCTKEFAVPLCTKKLEPHTFRTILYFKASTHLFPVSLCSTKPAQSTSQSYSVLQGLHKARPFTTLHYRACRK